MSDEAPAPPDEFDLAAAKSQRSTTADAERKHCPDCGSINIRPKSPAGRNKTRRAEGKYLCRNCGTHFS